MAAALGLYRLDGGKIVEPRLAVGGAEVNPRRIAEAERALAGAAPGDTAFRAAARSRDRRDRSDGGQHHHRRIPPRPRARGDAPGARAGGGSSAPAQRGRGTARSAVEGASERRIMRAPSKVVGNARQLRRTLSVPEARLWNRLRTRLPGQPIFRRQHPIGPYVLDFYCAKAHLAIEIDGVSHTMGDRPQHDERRDAWLKKHGER